ncbi:MAG: hypothetical protein IPK31_16900 [Chitinophagaceae bacterium]|nr:hypothetical protein [Chitinophagaceae bacterium]
MKAEKQPLFWLFFNILIAFVDKKKRAASKRENPYKTLVGQPMLERLFPPPLRPLL